MKSYNTGAVGDCNLSHESRQALVDSWFKNSKSPRHKSVVDGGRSICEWTRDEIAALLTSANFSCAVTGIQHSEILTLSPDRYAAFDCLNIVGALHIHDSYPRRKSITDLDSTYLIGDVIPMLHRLNMAKGSHPWFETKDALTTLCTKAGQQPQEFVVGKLRAIVETLIANRVALPLTCLPGVEIVEESDEENDEESDN